ncbi:MAG: PAS fold family [Parcubacteria group bacterium GW2011_GWF2_38_76]|nr:MAG: PAS fold family [Parcubacteria group bacterium GW2011_GWF2_38_76]HBM45460.1 hypothetical protein [Patescibacteria group bacterium]
MNTPFLFLCLQTVIFWIIAVVLHQQKKRITLIPLYAYIAILTLLTHNFSDLGFSITVNGWFFLVASFSFFTTMMFSTLFLYLFDGPKAVRLALWIILFSSFFYIGVVYLLGFQVDVSDWVHFDHLHAPYYFWSIVAILADIIFLGLVWELLSRISSLNLLIRVFLVTLLVFEIDTIIFTTGVFWGEEFYSSMLSGNLITRLAFSVIAAPIMTYFLSLEGFDESKREKPKSYWEILNFSSDLESKIQTLEGVVEHQRDLEKKLRDSEERYSLAIGGAGAGVWDWDMVTNKIEWSPKFLGLLGYSLGELGGDLESFKKILHPEDTERTFSLIDQIIKEDKSYEIEYRLKTKSGEYRWFMANGITKYDEKMKPLRMVGTIIDINKRKVVEQEIEVKLAELNNLNKFMVGRELKMVELKKEIAELKSGQSQK